MHVRPYPSGCKITRIGDGDGVNSMIAGYNVWREGDITLGH